VKRTRPYATAPARAAVVAPVQLDATERCPSCGRHVPLLVEGSDLCMTCDRFHFPALVEWR
jgi:hypothetical protein